VCVGVGGCGWVCVCIHLFIRHMGDIWGQGNHKSPRDRLHTTEESCVFFLKKKRLHTTLLRLHTTEESCVFFNKKRLHTTLLRLHTTEESYCFFLKKRLHTTLLNVALLYFFLYHGYGFRFSV